MKAAPHLFLENGTMIFSQGTTSMTLKFNYPFCGRLGKRFEGLVLHEVRTQLIEEDISGESKPLVESSWLMFSAVPRTWPDPHPGEAG